MLDNLYIQAKDGVNTNKEQKQDVIIIPYI